MAAGRQTALPKALPHVPSPTTSSAASVFKNPPFALRLSGNDFAAETHLRSLSSHLCRPMEVWLCTPTLGRCGHPSSAPWPCPRSLSHVACVATPRPVFLWQTLECGDAWFCPFLWASPHGSGTQELRGCSYHDRATTPTSTTSILDSLRCGSDHGPNSPLTFQRHLTQVRVSSRHVLYLPTALPASMAGMAMPTPEAQKVWALLSPLHLSLTSHRVVKSGF